MGDLKPEEINCILKDILPEYMIPNKKVKLKSLPINMNGKIDRIKLEELI